MNPIRVTGSDDWSKVNDALDEFSDGSVKELRFDSSDWLGDDDRLRYGEDRRLLVIVQLQSSDARSAVLSFGGVSRFEIDMSRDVCPAVTQTLDSDSWRVEFLSCIVEAETCLVTTSGDRYLGEGPFIRLYE